MGDERVTRNNKPKMEEVVANMAEQLGKLMQDQSTNFAAIKKSQKELMNSHKEIQADIQGLKQKYDEVNEHVSQTTSRVDKLEDSVNQLTQQVNFLKQERLQQNLVITGIPKSNINDLIKYIICIATNVGVTISQSDITNAFMINTNNLSKHIVKFANAETRNNILRARRKRSIYTDEIGVSTCPRTQVFIQEDLTIYTQKLFFNARKLKKEANFETIFTENGFVYAVKDANSGRIKIVSTDQINKFLLEHNKPDTEEDKQQFR
jgi:uncharacterized protein YoxC